MIHKITVIPDSHAAKVLFFKEINIDDLPDPRIVPLFGANGSGKTTILSELEDALYFYKYNEEDHPEDSRLVEALRGIHSPKKLQVDLEYDKCKTVYFRYRNSTDNFGDKECKWFDPVALNLKYDAKSLSEGQSIVFSAEALLKGMLKPTKNRESFIEDDQHGIVLIDELDSGMSMDNIRDMMKIIQRVLKQKRNIQFFISFNNPYVLNFFPYVISMYDGKVHHITSMNEMLEELDKNRDMLRTARRKSNGDFKIYE